MADLVKIPCDMLVPTSADEYANLNPILEATDVSITAKGYSGTNAQTFVNSLGPTAFNNFFNGISDSTASNDNTHCLSINTILNRQNTEWNSMLAVILEYSGWF